MPLLAMNKPLRMVATLALLGASLLPSTVFAQTDNSYPYRVLPVACAVGYDGGPERVAMTFESTPVPELVDIQAQVCTELISSGGWSGIDSQGSWKPSMRLVAILQPTAIPDLGVNIWSTPDTQSTQMATNMASQLNQDGGYRVSYPNS